MIELPINSVINYKGHKLQVTAKDDCENCIFNRYVTCSQDNKDLNIVGKCAPDFRNDKTSVIFKQID